MIHFIAAMLAAHSVPAEQTISAAGPQGVLEATLRSAGGGAPVVLVPGSRPTDRGGDNPIGVKAAPYRLLAQELSNLGVTIVRIDKLGMSGSKSAIPDANKVTIADYASDVHFWAAVARKTTGEPSAWVAGHSEGGDFVTARRK